MEPALLLSLSLASYVGFALLALSQDRHWERAGGARRCPARLIVPLRGLGYGLLLVSLVLARCATVRASARSCGQRC
ncbi:MAG: hypothetical protein JWQ58_3196 [Reyranella sp.]|nr:hypothetical protein [Reyranella sp.]